MKIAGKGMIAHLHGRLTHRGVTDNIIHTLAVSLRRVESLGAKSIRIDCRKIRSADPGGLNLLYVWMQCVKFRGVDSVLINLPDGLHQSMMSLGYEDCFAL